MTTPELAPVSLNLSGNNLTEVTLNNTAVENTDFFSIVQSNLEGVNESIVDSNTNIERLVLGENVSTHDLLINMEQAKLKLQLTLEVRNKLVEGYQELMRMQL